MMVTFRTFLQTDCEAICDFLIALNRFDRSHINWNWARFAWMYGHPYTDRMLLGSIGLWFEADRIVGAALFDMYFGEAFCGVLPGFEALYPDVLNYAYAAMKDDSGLAVAIEDRNAAEIETAVRLGFSPIEQFETVQSITLDRHFPVVLPEGYSIASIDPKDDVTGMEWLFWQGFDHGTDYEAFLNEPSPKATDRPHFRCELSLRASGPDGVPVAYACLWKHDRTDYAYVEPVCTIPSERRKGLARALLCEAMNRASHLGAKAAYVISDQTFYRSLGFTPSHHFTYYRKA